MPTSHFHHLHLLLIAQGAAVRAATASVQANALTDDALVAIIMSATASEAFINELADSVHVSRDSSLYAGRISARLLACADILKEVEDAHGSVTLKYLVASFSLSGRTFETGKNPFQDFAELIKLRNAIVHLKPQDKVGPKRTDSLANRGLAHSTDTYQMAWVDRLQTPECAAWAVKTARNIMLSINAMTPSETEAGELDPLDFQKKFFRDHPGFASISLD